MAKIDQMIFGAQGDGGLLSEPRTLLSTGLSDEERTRYEKLCLRWWDDASAFDRSVFSLPLWEDAPPPAAPSHVIVVRAKMQDNEGGPLFHLVRLPESIYRKLDYNPFHLLGQMRMLNQWDAGSSLPDMVLEAAPTQDAHVRTIFPERYPVLQSMLSYLLSEWSLQISTDEDNTAIEESFQHLLELVPVCRRRNLSLATYCFDTKDDFLLCAFRQEGARFHKSIEAMRNNLPPQLDPESRRYVNELFAALTKRDWETATRLVRETTLPEMSAFPAPHCVAGEDYDQSAERLRRVAEKVEVAVEEEQRTREEELRLSKRLGLVGSVAGESAPPAQGLVDEAFGDLDDEEVYVEDDLDEENSRRRPAMTWIVTGLLIVVVAVAGWRYLAGRQVDEPTPLVDAGEFAPQTPPVKWIRSEIPEHLDLAAQLANSRDPEGWRGLRDALEDAPRRPTGPDGIALVQELIDSAADLFEFEDKSDLEAWAFEIPYTPARFTQGELSVKGVRFLRAFSRERSTDKRFPAAFEQAFGFYELILGDTPSLYKVASTCAARDVTPCGNRLYDDHIQRIKLELWRRTSMDSSTSKRALDSWGAEAFPEGGRAELERMLPLMAKLERDEPSPQLIEEVVDTRDWLGSPFYRSLLGSWLQKQGVEVTSETQDSTG